MAAFVATDTQISVDEPVFIHNAFQKATPLAQTSQSSKSGTFQPYCPGEMLAHSAAEPSSFEQQFGNAPLGTGTVCAKVQANDHRCSSGSESDCSTTDTTDDAMSPMRMAAADASAWMPNMAMLGEGNWPAYSPPGYWMQQMQYPDASLQVEQAWSQTWLPPAPTKHNAGEKQRRKRVMRSMQRSTGSP